MVDKEWSECRRSLGWQRQRDLYTSRSCGRFWSVSSSQNGTSFDGKWYSVHLIHFDGDDESQMPNSKNQGTTRIGCSKKETDRGRKEKNWPASVSLSSSLKCFFQHYACASTSRALLLTPEYSPGRVQIRATRHVVLVPRSVRVMRIGRV